MNYEFCKANCVTLLLLPAFIAPIEVPAIISKIFSLSLIRLDSESYTTLYAPASYARKGPLPYRTSTLDAMVYPRSRCAKKYC